MTASLLIGKSLLTLVSNFKSERRDKTMQSCLEQHVSALMGRAKILKLENKSGKLTEGQKEALEASAIDGAKASAMAILGVDSLPYTDEWLKASTAYYVKLAKMQYIGSGLFQAEVEQEIADIISQHQSIETDDDDDEEEDDE